MNKTSDLPYYTFYEDKHTKKVEGRYWNPQGYDICVVAVITKGIDWAAYIGASPNAPTENIALQEVASWGAKLSRQDAIYFFPDIPYLPYRD